MFTTIFPITFLANTFAPTEQMTPWLRTIAEWNPISSLVQALRELWGNDLAGARQTRPLPLHHPVLFAADWSVGSSPWSIAPLALRAFNSRTQRVGDRMGRGQRPTTLPPMASPSLSVTLDDVRAAQDLLSGVVRPTPLEYSRALSDRVGAEVYLKCENLQRAGSFKIRGAYTRMARLSDEEKARGVVAASAGNHAQGVALAGQLLGIDVKVYMPHGAPMPKLARDQGLRRHHRAGRDHHRRVPGQGARRGRPSTGAVLIHPFDHRDIVAGQGTAGLEILDQCPDVKTIVVSTGGGGLLAGISVGGQGARARRAHHRRAGRAGRGLPLVAGGRASRSPSRTCRRWPTASPSACPATCPTRWCATWSTGWRRSARRSCRGRCCSCSSAPSSSSSRRARPRSPTCSTDAGQHARRPGGRGPVRRQHRPAAPAAHHPPRHGRRRALPAVPGAGLRPPRPPGPAARRLRGRRRQRPRGRAHPHRHDDHRRRGRDRAAARDPGPASTAKRSCAPCAAKGYQLKFG